MCENGNCYVFGIIDGESKFLLHYFMKTKDEVLEMFQSFHTNLSHSFGRYNLDLGPSPCIRIWEKGLYDVK